MKEGLLVTTVESANKINPHMKFQTPQGGVVNPVPIYRYSINNELKEGDQLLKEVNTIVKRSRLQNFADKHPNLKSSIWGVVKFTSLILAGLATFRYRHSIPILKDICKAPKITPPNFKADVQRIWNGFWDKINK